MLVLMRRLKDEIAEQLACGIDEPQVRVPPGALIITKTKKGWKLRAQPKGWRTTKEKYPGWIMRTSSGAPLRCRNIGCNVFLRKYDRDIVCSELCRTLLREWCYIFLDILEGIKPPESLPMWCRSQRAPGQKVKERLLEMKKAKKKEERAKKKAKVK